MAKLFTVYEIDRDDKGCVRLYVNTDIPWPISDKAIDLLIALIDNLDDAGALTEADIEGNKLLPASSYDLQCSSCLQIRATWDYRGLHLCNRCWRKRQAVWAMLNASEKRQKGR